VWRELGLSYLKDSKNYPSPSYSLLSFPWVSKEESIETGFVPTLAVMMHYIHLIDSHNIISKRSRLQLGITHHPKNQKFSKVKEKKKKDNQ